MTNPKILFLDIETAPNLATVWSIWNQNIGVNQLLESSYTLCWAAKWRGNKDVLFDSVKKSGKKGVIKSIWKLINEADIVVHYNGKKFDIPVLNREFLLYNLTPPAPYKQIDLYLSIKSKFMFVSHKLGYITKHLGYDGKIETTHKLWLDCMNNDEKAWIKMERYNKNDVKIMEKVYNRVLPWIDSHPNMGIYSDVNRPACTNCGGHKLQSRGIVITKVNRYKRYQCQDCGAWVRERKSERYNSKNVLTQCLV